MATPSTTNNPHSIPTIEIGPGRSLNLILRLDVNVAPVQVNLSAHWLQLAQVNQLIETALLNPSIQLLKELEHIYAENFEPIQPLPPLLPQSKKSKSVSSPTTDSAGCKSTQVLPLNDEARSQSESALAGVSGFGFGQPGTRHYQLSRATKAQHEIAAQLNISPIDVLVADQATYVAVGRRSAEPDDFWDYLVELNRPWLDELKLPKGAVKKLEFLSIHMTSSEFQLIYKPRGCVSYTTEIDPTTQQEICIMEERFRIISDHFYKAVAEPGKFKETFDGEIGRDLQRVHTNSQKKTSTVTSEQTEPPVLKSRKTMWWWFKFVMQHDLGRALKLSVLAELMRRIGFAKPKKLAHENISDFFRLVHLGCQLHDTIQFIRLTIRIQSGFDPLQIECHDDTSTKQTSDQAALPMGRDESDTVSEPASDESLLSDQDESAMDVESEIDESGESRSSDTSPRLPSPDPTIQSEKQNESQSTSSYSTTIISASIISDSNESDDDSSTMDFSTTPPRSPSPSCGLTDGLEHEKCMDFSLNLSQAALNRESWDLVSPTAAPASFFKQELTNRMGRESQPMSDHDTHDEYCEP